MMGLSGQFAVECVIFDRRVRTLEELCHLRDALARLADHLRQVARAQAA